MKILYVAESFPPFVKGGAAISTAQIVKFISKDHKCCVVTQEFQRKIWKFENSDFEIVWISGFGNW